MNNGRRSIPFTVIFSVAAGVLQPANAQDFRKVVDIIVEIENDLRRRITSESSQRQAEIAGLRTELEQIRSVIEHQHGVVASEEDEKVQRMLVALEQRLQALEDIVQADRSEFEMTRFVAHRQTLIDELKHVIEQGQRPDSGKVSAQQAQPVGYSVTGQIRHRSELDGKNFAVGARVNGLHLLRSRLTFTATPLPDVKVVAQVQDARMFGGGNPALARGTMDGSAKGLDFHEAYFSVAHVFDTPLLLKIGRQELVYGNERLIGGVGWSNTGRAFDGIVISYHTGDVGVDLFWSKLVGSLTTSYSENLRGLYATLRFSRPHVIDAYILLDDNTNPLPSGVDAGKARLGRMSTGAYVRARLGAFEYEAEAAYQGGKSAINDTSARASIDAYLVSGSVGYLVHAATEWRIGLLATLLSGDNDSRDNKLRTFNTLFATNHKFYGYMDYFPGVYPSNGLIDIAVSSSFKMTSNFSLAVVFHQFTVHQPVFIPAGDGSKKELRQLGYEIDITANLKYNSRVSVVGGVSAMFPGELMRAARGPATSHWSYLMTIINF